MVPIVFAVLGGLRPILVSAPVEMVRAHVATVAHAKQQGAHRPILVFVHFAGRVDDEIAWFHRNGLGWGPHGAPAGKAKVDFCCVRMAVIGANLAGFPAGYGEVAVGNFAEDLLNMMLGIPLLFMFEAEGVHGDGAPARMSAKPNPIMSAAGRGGVAHRPRALIEGEYGPVAQLVRADRS
jgi:hypothetical protein